jgi:hypothetical protein
VLMAKARTDSRSTINEYDQIPVHEWYQTDGAGGADR